MGVYVRTKNKVIEFLSKLRNIEFENSNLIIALELVKTGPRRVIGYLKVLEDRLSRDVAELLKRKCENMSIPQSWGLNLAVYKVLWNISTLPTYLSAIEHIEEAIKELDCLNLNEICMELYNLRKSPK